MNITLYGASSKLMSDNFKNQIELLGEKIAERGDTLIFGGGANGAMGAAARGAKRKNAVGIIGISPSFFNVDGVLYDQCTEFIYTETMRERKKLLADKADAFVITPGGVGTFDEFFEILSLKQLGRLQKPIAIFNIDGYYDPLVDLLNNAIKHNLVFENNLKLYKMCKNIEEIFKYFDNYDYQDTDINNLRDYKNNT